MNICVFDVSLVLFTIIPNNSPRPLIMQIFLYYYHFNFAFDVFDILANPLARSWLHKTKELKTLPHIYFLVTLIAWIICSYKVLLTMGIMLIVTPTFAVSYICCTYSVKWTTHGVKWTLKWKIYISSRISRPMG